jgi:predicted NBD/HSP70 family sugar kinase
VAAVGLGGVINARSEYRLPGPGVDYDIVIERLADELRKLQKSVKPGGWLAGVGVGVPGAVRRADGFVEFAPNLGWRGVPFGDRLSQRLALPVHVGNDGDLGGLAEHVRGAGRGIGHLIYLAGEVGIGGGIVVDGRILTGAHGYGGELGRTAGGGRAALMEVFAAASHGETRALDGLQSIALWVARGLTSLVNILNPDVVILGGPLSSLFFLTGDRIKSEMDAMSTFAGRAQVRLLQPGLGEDSSLLGAAELAFEPLLDDPVDAWSRRAS